MREKLPHFLRCDRCRYRITMLFFLTVIPAGAGEETGAEDKQDQNQEDYETAVKIRGSVTITAGVTGHSLNISFLVDFTGTESLWVKMLLFVLGTAVPAVAEAGKKPVPKSVSFIIRRIMKLSS